MKVTVKDPQTEGKGRSQFTSYLVNTETTSVRRRYSDFQWLSQRLQVEIPGALIPCIPHKRTLHKLDPELVEERCRHLQFFMEGVLAHPDLARAPSMTPFMVDTMGDELEQGKKRVEAKYPSLLKTTTTTSGTNDTRGTSSNESLEDEDGTGAAKKQPIKAAKKGFSNLLAKAKTLTQVSTGRQELLQTPNEEEITTLKTYITQVETHAKTLLVSCEKLVQTTATQAEIVHELGVPMGEWKTTYQNSLSTGNDTLDWMSALIEFSTDYATLLRHQQEEQGQEFVQAMQQLLLTIQSIQMALKVRHTWQLAYTTKCQQINDKDVQIQKLQQQLKPPQVTEPLAKERNELQMQCQEIQTQWQACTDRVLQEASERQPQLQQMLQAAFYALAKVQLAYIDRTKDAWSQLLPMVTVQEDDNDDKDDGVEDSKTALPPASAPPPPPPPPPAEEGLLLGGASPQAVERPGANDE